MFALNIALANNAWRLLFRDGEEAKAIFEKISKRSNQGTHTVEDDFGQTFSAPAKSIAGVLFEDLEKTKLAQVEIALHNAHTNALATKMAQADPGLRASSAMNSPRMLDPTMNGYRPTN